MLSARKAALLSLVLLVAALAAVSAEVKVKADRAADLLSERENTLDVSFEEFTLADVVQYLAEKGGVNIVIDPKSDLATLKVSADLKGVTWLQVLNYLAEKYEFDVETSETGVYYLRQPKRIDLMADNAPLREVIRQIAEDAGFNLYVGLWKGPTEAQLEALRKAGMPVICAQNEVGLRHRDDPIIVGWMHGDEPDNAQRRPDGKGYGPPIPPAKIIADYQRMRAADPTRESRETFKSIEAEVRHSLQGGQVAESSHEDLHEPDHDESADPDAGRAAESGEPTGERDRRPSWYPEIQAPAPETAESNEPGPNPGEPESADSEPSEGH